MLGITSWGNINENASTCQIPGSTVNNNCLVTLLCLHTSWQCSQNTDSWQCIWDHTHGLCSYDHFTMSTISMSLTQVTIECQMEQLKKNMNCSHQEQQYTIWVLFSLAKIDMSLYQQYICGRNIWTLSLYCTHEQLSLNILFSHFL